MKWESSKAEVYYGDSRPSETSDCNVSLEAGSLKIIYEIDDGEVRWIGTDLGGGHFDLRAHGAVTGRASMHMMTPKSRFLEGWWQEDGEEGMWRISLKE